MHLIRIAVALLTLALAGGAVANTDVAPKSRSGETIILGKNDVIRINEPTSIRARLMLSGHARRFRRATNEAIYFAANSDALTQSAKVTLLEQAAWVAQHPNTRITITGYSDQNSDPLSTEALGLSRARNVAKFLVEAGVDRDQLIAIQGARISGRTPKTANEIAQKRRTITRIVELTEPNREDGDEGAVAASRGGFSDSRDNPGGVGSGGTKEKD